jgi:glucosamine-6-phosphate deaminase
MRSLQYDQMQVTIYDSNEAMGAAAADDLEQILRQAVTERGEAAVILATGNSQLTFLKALRGKQDLPWDKISIFHMDEYLGMSDQHPASFRRFIREKLNEVVQPRAFYGLAGDAADLEAEMARYSELLQAHRPVACVMGIGENGHIAFNDPPADFETGALIHVVSLDERARRQQVGEGHFPNLEAVPRQALSLTVHGLLHPPHLLVVVPESRKAEAVKAALVGPVSPDCPASILRTLAKAKLYLDPEAASLLETKK